MLTSLLIAALSQGPDAAPQTPLFHEDASALVGVTTTCGTPAKDYILEVNGGGLLLGDFDADGDPDLVVVDGSSLERIAAEEPGFAPRLYLNDGAGRFTPAGEAWDLAPGRWGMGGAVGDLDGDGFLDLVVTEWGPDRVFLNRGGAGFELVEESGLLGSRWGTSAALADLDGDGVLDLVVINYLAFNLDEIPPPGGSCKWKGHDVMCGPEGLTPVHDQLYRGRGDGTFEDVTVKWGMRPERAAFGLGVITLDHDLDGDIDLYVTNDSTPNFLWENQGDGTFREVGFQSSVSHDPNGREQAGMGIGCGDVDGDGRPDLLVTNFSGESNAFYQSRGERVFRERSSISGLAGPSMTTLGWGAGIADFDLDGFADAFCVNGHVYPQADRSGTDTTYAQADHFFRNRGNGRFEALPLSDGPPRVSRATAVADLDGDGDLDIVMIELDGGVHVLRNRTLGPEAPAEAEAAHWLRVRLEGRGAATIGARVTVSWEGGSRTAQSRTSGGYQSAVPTDVSFGLGPVGVVAELRVRWPGGAESVLTDVSANQVVTVQEPEQ